MKKFSKWYKRVVCILVISSLICSVSNVTEVAAETSEPFKDVVMETTLKSLASIFRQMKEDTAKDAEEVQKPEITVQPEVTQEQPLAWLLVLGSLLVLELPLALVLQQAPVFPLAA